MPETPNVHVLVSPELIKQLGEWSEPVQIKIIEMPGREPRYDMIARIPVPEQEGAPADA